MSFFAEQLQKAQPSVNQITNLLGQVRQQRQQQAMYNRLYPIIQKWSQPTTETIPGQQVPNFGNIVPNPGPINLQGQQPSTLQLPSKTMTTEAPNDYAGILNALVQGGLNPLQGFGTVGSLREQDIQNQAKAIQEQMLAAERRSTDWYRRNEIRLRENALNRQPRGAATKPTKFTKEVNGVPHNMVAVYDNEGNLLRTDDLGPASPGTGQATQTDVQSLIEGIRDGQIPPDISRNVGYRDRTAVVGGLAKQGYNLVTAQRDWQAIQKYMSTLNDRKQVTLRQAIEFTYGSLDQIEGLYNQLQKTGLPTGYKAWNKVALAAATQTPGETGAIAQALQTQINDLTSELGTVYKGGNAATDESLKLAAENLKANWNPQTFKKAINILRNTLRIRRNSILNTGVAGMNPNSPYGQGLGNQMGNIGPDNGVPQQQDSQFKVGQVYIDGNGNKAVYQADGTWKEIK